MIIDSHTHYCHNLYGGEFSYLTVQGQELSVARGNRESLLADMTGSGIAMCIEAGVCAERLPAQLALAEQWGRRVRLTVGQHPKHCAGADADTLVALERALRSDGVVAVGETGLDYSMETVDRNCQATWFDHQIALADAAKLPLVLHVRQAHEAALAQLADHRAQLHGGVAHCFYDVYETAKRYLDLGFALGIGGKLLSDDAEGRALAETVRQVPLSALVVETDAPFIRPDIRHLGQSGGQRKRTRNTSLILPLVIARIAQLRGENAQVVEAAVYDNTVALFHLQGKER